jgi:hypothetical protein
LFVFSRLGNQASWSALNVIYMYCFGNKSSINKLSDSLKQLVLSVPLHKDQKSAATGAHQWHDLAKKLLKDRDDAFALALTNQLIAACQEGLNYGDIRSYAEPLLLDLMKEYGDVVWPVLGDAIIEAEGMERYWLQQLLGRETSFGNNMPSVLSVVPVKNIIDWCSGFPESGPTFVASCLNVFEVVEDQQQPSKLFLSLLEYFGDDQGVTNALAANIGSRSWSGSLVPYLKSDKEALSPLLEHKNSNVRRWIKDYIAYIDRQIEAESMRDEERDIGFY